MSQISLSALIEAILSCLEFDHLVQFSLKDNCLALNVTDSYQVNCLTHHLKSAHDNESTFQTSVHVKPSQINALKKFTHIHFVHVQCSPTGSILIQTTDDHKLCEFLTLKYPPHKRYDLFHIPEDQIVSTVQFSQVELLRCFMNLTAFSGLCKMTLNSTGQFVLESNFELGKCHISRQLHGFAQSTPEDLFNHFIIIKFTKALNTNNIQHSLCNLVWCNNGVFHIKYRSNEATQSVLAMRSVDYLQKILRCSE